MPSQVRKPDVDSVMASNTTSSPDTFCNSLQVTRKFDSRSCGAKDKGTHDVYTNNRDNQAVGDPDTLGHTQVVGSPNVFIN